MLLEKGTRVQFGYKGDFKYPQDTGEIVGYTMLEIGIFYAIKTTGGTHSQVIVRQKNDVRALLPEGDQEGKEDGRN